MLKNRKNIVQNQDLTVFVVERKIAMTGSDNSSCKGSRRPSVQQQQQQQRGGEGCSIKGELIPTNQLRRLAIKNAYGNKSLPSSPLSSRSASTNSLDQISSSPTPTNTPSKSTESLLSTSSAEDSSLTPTTITPPLLSTADKLVSSSTTSRSMQLPQVHQQGSGNNNRASPYITRQELLHSLRRTSSNFSMTHSTMCSGASSYVHYTPRHLTRTNFNNPRPVLPSRSSATTPDSGLERESDEIDHGDLDETKSMVEMNTSTSRPVLMSPPRRSGSRANVSGMSSSAAQQYRRMELLAPPPQSRTARKRVPTMHKVSGPQYQHVLHIYVCCLHAMLPNVFACVCMCLHVCNPRPKTV